MSKETRLLKNTAILAIGNICTKGVSFLLLPLYTSILNTAEYGTVDLITSYTGLLTVILTLQLEQGLFRFLVEARDNVRKQSEYILSALLCVVAVLGVFSVAAGAVLEKLRYPFTKYLLLNTVMGVLNAVILQIPRGMGDIVTYAAASTISGSANVIMNVLFVAVLRQGVEGMLTASLAALLLSSVFVALRMRNFRWVSSFSFASLRELLVFSLPLIPYTLCWWVIGASDRVVITHMLGIGYNGIYAVANKFPSLFNMVSGIFQTAWIESAYENVNDRERNRYYERMINSAVRFYMACCIGVTVLLPFVFSRLVNAEYRDAYYYIPILLLAAMFHTISSMYGAMYFALKQVRKVMFSTMLAAVINLAVNLLLIQKIGLYAAAFSTLAAYLSNMLFRYFDIHRLLGITVSRRFLTEAIAVYLLVLAGYYFRLTWLQCAVLPVAVIWCVSGNRELIGNSLKTVKEKFEK